MITLSSDLKKALLLFLCLIPWFSLYQKNLFPHLAQTGFDGEIITLLQVIFIAFITIFGQHPKFTKSGGAILLAVTLWQVSGYISALLSDHFHASLIKQIKYSIHCIFAYCVWVFISQTEKQKQLAWFVLFTFVWMTYYIYSAWYIQPSPYSINWVHQTPFFNNIRHSGFILILILPILFLPLTNNIKNKTLITIALLSLYWGLLIWTSSRGTFFASLISIGLIAYALKDYKRIGFIIIISHLIGWIIALQFPSTGNSLNPLRLLFLNFIGDIPINTSTLSAQRSGMWMETLQQFLNHNALFGYGADGYKYLTPKMLADTVHPHNSLIQLIGEYGFIGLLIIILMSLAFLSLWKKSDNTSTLNILCRISIITFIVGSLVDGHLYYDFSLIYLCIFLALSLPAAQNSISYNWITPVVILFTLTACITQLKEHWHTYIEQQIELISPLQIEQVSSYPSYYLPVKWLYSNTSNPKLQTQAIELGKIQGPNHCNYYLEDYKRGNKDKELVTKIETICKRSELNKFSITNFEGTIKHEK